MKNNWDFWSIGFEYPISWDDFVEEVRRKELLDRFDWVMDRIHDRLDQNAFYWFTMNLAALRSRERKIRFLPYERIADTERIATEYIQPSSCPSIKEPRFSGDYIHTDYPLRSITRSGERSVLSITYSINLNSSTDSGFCCLTGRWAAERK